MKSYKSSNLRNVAVIAMARRARQACSMPASSMRVPSSASQCGRAHGVRSTCEPEEENRGMTINLTCRLRMA